MSQWSEVVSVAARPFHNLLQSPTELVGPTSCFEQVRFSGRIVQRVRCVSHASGTVHRQVASDTLAAFRHSSTSETLRHRRSRPYSWQHLASLGNSCRLADVPGHVALEPCRHALAGHWPGVVARASRQTRNSGAPELASRSFHRPTLRAQGACLWASGLMGASVHGMSLGGREAQQHQPRARFQVSAFVSQWVRAPYPFEPGSLRELTRSGSA